MSITVRELLQLPHLQASLIAGADGLDRDITWVHTSRLSQGFLIKQLRRPRLR